MILTVSNFRIIRDTVTQEFRSGAITLLHGRSGSGKTTLLEAVRWCLYGGRDNVAPRGMTKPKTRVVVEFNAQELGFPVVLTRSKPSESFKITINSEQQLTGVEAQSWVFHHFGSSGFFELVSYMVHENRWPMLNLSAAERFNLLQELTFGYNDVEVHQKPGWCMNRVDTELRLAKINMTRAEAAANIVARISPKVTAAAKERWLQLATVLQPTSLEITLESIEASLVKYTKLNSEIPQELRGLYQQASQLSSRLARTREQQRQQKNQDWERARIAEQLSKLPCYEHLTEQATYLKAQAKQQRIKETLEAQHAMLQKLDIQLDNHQIQAALDFKSSCVDYLEKLEGTLPISQLREQLETRLTSLRNAMIAEDEAIAVHTSSSLYRDCVLQHNAKLRASFELAEAKLKRCLAEEPQAVTESFEELQHELLNASNLSCPKCSAVLCLIGQELVPGSGSLPKRSASLINSQIAAKHAHVKWQQRRQQLEQEFQTATEVSYEEVPEDTPKPKSNRATLEKEIWKISTILKSDTTEINDVPLEVVLKTSQAQIDTLISWARAQEVYDNLPQLESPPLTLGLTAVNQYLEIYTKLLAQRDVLGNSFEPITEDFEALRTEFARISQRIKELEKLQTSSQDFVTAMHVLQPLLLSEAQSAELIETLTVAVKRVENLVRLRELLQHAINLSLQRKIAGLNSLLAELSEKLFDYGLTIRLNTTRELKTRDTVKNEIYISVITADEEFTFTDNKRCNLSAGEKDRISFAIALVFSRDTMTPLLFIDEAMQSMDPPLREKCLKLAREYLPGKIVVNVCHGLAQGYHDKVVEVQR